jgi:large subunit ribosomal protein L3
MARGSLQYWQKRRAYRRLPRVRNYFSDSKEPSIVGIVGYKAGMTHATVAIAGKQEEARACTIIEVPRIEAYGIRLYKKERGTGYKKILKEFHDKNSAQRAGVKKSDDYNAESAKALLSETVDVSVLMAAYPKGMATGQHHPDRFESHISGKDIAKKFELANGILGKEIKPGDIFKEGEHTDIITITKGKGWAGVIKRFGVARLNHKATQKIRHVGVLGSFGIGRVLYSVPQSGQLGFNYRTEQNKRILKIGRKEDVESINPKSGFINYGKVKSDFIIIDGSVGGPAKRLVRIRKSITNVDSKGIKEAKVTYIATTERSL